MATQFEWLKFNNSTDADFRAWVQFIIDAFTTGGWIRTADTGQIDTGTVTAPVATGAVQGYVILRMADALQATAPVFVKVEFGSHTGTVALPRLHLTLGTGSNGTGSLTGVVTTRTAYQPGVTLAGGAPDVDGNYRGYSSSDTNRCVFAMGVGSASHQASMIVSIERTVDTAGDDTATGAVVHVAYGAGVFHHFVAPQALPLGTPTTGNVEMPAPNVGNGQKGADVVYYPLFVFNPELMNPSRNVLGYFTTDVPDYTEADVTHYGEAQTMIHLGASAQRFSAYAAGTAIRFE